MNDISLKWSMGIAAWNSIKEEKGAKYEEMVRKGRVMTAAAMRGTQGNTKQAKSAAAPATQDQLVVADTVVTGRSQLSSAWPI